MTRILLVALAATALLCPRITMAHSLIPTPDVDQECQLTAADPQYDVVPLAQAVSLCKMKEAAAIHDLPRYIRVIEQVVPRRLERCIDVVGPLAGRVDNYYDLLRTCITSY